MSRARRSLWILTAAAILFTGVLAQELAAPASLTADVLVAAGGLGLAISAALLYRVLRFLTRPPTGPAARSQPPAPR